jgi:hypothetical protein
VSAPVLELAGDENLPVARGASFLVAARTGDGKANDENRQRGKRNPFHGARLLHIPCPAKKFFVRKRDYAL